MADDAAVDRLGIREASGLLALGAIVIVVVALAIASGHGGAAYLQHMRAVMLMATLLSVEIAVAAIWLWLSFTAQIQRVRALLIESGGLSEERRDLIDATKAMAAAGTSLSAVLAQHTASADAIGLVLERAGIDTIVATEARR